MITNEVPVGPVDAPGLVFDGYDPENLGAESIAKYDIENKSLVIIRKHAFQH